MRRLLVEIQAILPIALLVCSCIDSEVPSDGSVSGDAEESHPPEEAGEGDDGSDQDATATDAGSGDAEASEPSDASAAPDDASQFSDAGSGDQDAGELSDAGAPGDASQLSDAGSSNGDASVTNDAGSTGMDGGALDASPDDASTSPDATATPAFVALGGLMDGITASYASAVSESGDVVVGWTVSSTGDQAFRWAAATGLVNLGGLASRSLGVSPDGERTVGVATFAGKQGGAVWSNANPAAVEAVRRLSPVYLRSLSDGGVEPWQVPIFSSLEATVVRNDGSIYGRCENPDPPPSGNTRLQMSRGCRFSSPSLGNVIGNNDGVWKVSAADDRGHYSGQGGSIVPIATVFSTAIINNSQLGYTDDSCGPEQAAADCAVDAVAFSVDPPLIVGNSKPYPAPANGSSQPDRSQGRFETAFVARWTESGLRRLRDLDGGETRTGAYAISPNSRVIGGFATDAAGKQAVLWLDESPVPIEQIMRDAGVDIPAGWRLLEVRGFSLDTRVIIGNGLNAQGASQAFRVALPVAPIQARSAYDAGTAADNAPPFDAGAFQCASPLTQRHANPIRYGWGCSCSEDSLPPGAHNQRGYCYDTQGIVCFDGQWLTTFGGGPCAQNASGSRPTPAECAGADGIIIQSGNACPDGYYSVEWPNAGVCCYPLTTTSAECSAVGFHVEATPASSLCSGSGYMRAFISGTDYASVCCG